jgi:tetratricopeptide (TPR) repeat protein
MHLTKSIQVVFFSIFLCGSISLHAATNFLQADHEESLSRAIDEEKKALTAWDRAWELNIQAVALNSLDETERALKLIDQALSMVESTKNKDFVATKAAIYFHMNKPLDALYTLKSDLEKTREFALSESGGIQHRMVRFSTFTSGFITATFASMQLGKWEEAINTLADAHSILEGPKFYAYRSLVYLYIMTRANDPSLANAELEKSASYYISNDKSHYGALLRMWKGENTSEEFLKIVETMEGSEQQEALSEGFFYSGAYSKYVKNDQAGASEKLNNLNQLAPYGSLEWIYGRRVLDHSK